MARGHDRGDDITAEFWGGAPDWTAAGRRSHRTPVAAASVAPVAAAHEPPAQVPIDPVDERRSRSAPIDPLLARLSAILLVVVIAAGALFALVDDGDRRAARQVMTNAAVAANYADLIGWLPRSAPVADPSDTATADIETPPGESSTAGFDTGANATTLECGLEYQIAPGDYWIRIAESAQVGLGDLLAVNAATVDTMLFAGDRICLPRGARYPAPPPTSEPTSEPGPSTVPSTPSTTVPRPVAGAPRPTPAPATAAAPAGTAPAAAPSTTVAAARPSTESPAEVEALIRSIWPADLADRAVQIAQRESRLRPGAHNGHCCWGIFQIHWSAHRRWLADHGITQAQQLLDARTNIGLAYVIYQRAGGWGPWRLSGE